MEWMEPSMPMERPTKNLPLKRPSKYGTAPNITHPMMPWLKIKLLE